ncbi:RING-H2 finger protein ATL78 [Linum perenne]
MEIQIIGISRRLLDIQTTIVSPPTGGGANFDANMVIILAALLCALIRALGLNSIVRCALRCSRRFVGEEFNRR